MAYEHANGDPLATLGGRIRAARQLKGLSTAEAADEIDVSRSALSTWERGVVANPPEDKLKQFAKLTGVEYVWLKDASGQPPGMTPKAIHLVPQPQFPILPPDQAQPPATLQLPAPGSVAPMIAEIKASRHVHANELDLTPQASWSIPREVLTIGFNCDPENAVIKRVMMPVTMPDGTTVQRGDYVLIDGSRDVINEPGLYYAADPDGKEVKRILASDDGDGKLKLTNDKGVPLNGEPDSFTVLGRAMGRFHEM